MSSENDKKKHIENLLANVHPMDNYKNDFAKNCTKHDSRISTGILTLDKVFNGGLANELYIIGAETSTGKSALLMSIAQNVAAAGTNVLYFSLEMGRDEFVARGISAISFEQHQKNKKEKLITAANILYWTYDHKLNDFTKLSFSTYKHYADEYFKRYGKNLHIIESGLTGLTVNEIANMASIFKRNSGKPVIVFVDYLQIIRADSTDRSQSDRKTKIDTVVTTLKTLASQIGMPVITISSISRSNYNGTINTSSFKESGDTEYTGGVLIGWNWDGVTNQSDEAKRDEEKQACKDRGYRKMILNVLKYRNAERDSSVRLKYYPAYNYFEEDDGWDAISKDKDTPFGTSVKKIIKA